MHNSGLWQRVSQELTEARPHETVALASAPQRFHPELSQFRVEAADACLVYPVLDAVQRSSHAAHRCLPQQHERPSITQDCAAVRKPQKIERLRLW